jgi:hypothetical protein
VGVGLFAVVVGGAVDGLPRPVRRASRKEQGSMELLVDDGGLDSHQHCSLLRPLGTNGWAVGDMTEERDAGDVREGEAMARTWRWPPDHGMALVWGLGRVEHRERKLREPFRLLSVPSNS